MQVLCQLNGYLSYDLKQSVMVEDINDEIRKNCDCGGK